MIAGRPTNLWLGLATAIAGALGTTLLVLGVDPAIVAQLVSAYAGVAGAVIALVAGQPPTLNPGDTFTVQTPKGQPNYETTVAHPPAQDPPPVPVTDGGG